LKTEARLSTSSEAAGVAEAQFERRPTVGYLLAALAAFGWATGALISKWLFSQPSAETATWPVAPLGIEIDPTVLAGSRAFSSTLILLVVLAVFRRADLKLANPIKDLRFLVPFGAIALAGVHFTYFKTISLTGVATAILLQYLAPIFTLGYALIFLRERLRWQMPVGVLLAILGAAVVVGAFGAGGLSISTAGLMWGLTAAVWFGAYTVLGAEGGCRFHPYTLLFYSLLFAAVMWMVTLGPAAVLHPFADPGTAVAIGTMAVFSTVIPFGAYLLALRHISPTHAALTAMLEPVAAGVGAWILLGESLTAGLITGGVLVIGAIALIQLSEDRVIVHPEVVSECEIKDFATNGSDGTVRED